MITLKPQALTHALVILLLALRVIRSLAKVLRRSYRQKRLLDHEGCIKDLGSSASSDGAFAQKQSVCFIAIMRFIAIRMTITRLITSSTINPGQQYLLIQHQAEGTS